MGRLRRRPGTEDALREYSGRVYIREEAGLVKGVWAGCFSGGVRTLVEIGAGKGQFLCSLAQQHPEYRLIGVEREAGVLLQAVRKAAGLGLANLKFVLADAEFLPAIFAPGEIDELYIHFCDPWPKSRHARRRLTHPGFLAIYRLLLSPAGRLVFKTDNVDLYDYSLAMFAAENMEILRESRNFHAGEVLSGCVTEYEAKFAAAGLPVHYCQARFRPGLGEMKR